MGDALAEIERGAILLCFPAGSELFPKSDLPDNFRRAANSFARRAPSSLIVWAQQDETKQQEQRRQETEPEIFRQHPLSRKITRALRTAACVRR